MSNYKTVTYTWQELFDKVWEQPLLQIAKEIGVSDVALGKACRKAGIPLPGRGYWAKSERERARTRSKRTAKHDAQPITFEVLKPEFVLKVPKPTGNPADRVPVPAKLSDHHPLIERTLNIAKRIKPYDGRLVLKKGLDVRVSPEAFDRAIRIFDTIIKWSQAKGCTWRVTTEGKTVVTCDGESMKVGLKERLTKKERPRPPPPPVRPGERQLPNFAALHPEYDWISTNQLTFTIDEYVDVFVRKNWNDAKVVTMEDRVHDIVSTFPVMALAIRDTRERSEARRREYEEEAQREEDAKRKAEALRLVRKRMINHMQRWEQSVRIHRFCDAVEATASRDQESVQAVVWLSWAREQADLLNPLSGDLKRLLSLSVKVPEWFKGMNHYEKPESDWWTDSDE
ncbi:hypothetical protein [Dyella jiangningensis]|uniref:RWP-RK domain-containing protein n=1 Tax=Dyella jiangningensis TaxID=1379159 RepID=A0A328P0R6_9GAMM|nr:hypothetical protein [Dyella jiangningensis]RAO74953.1 hypothetical protein CA260_12580 [Dyella jiangningensis]